MWLALGAIFIVIVVLVVGIGLGAVIEHFQIQSEYVKRLERIANLAELMQETRGKQNQELAQIRLAVTELRQAVAAVRSRGRKDLN